MLDPKQLRNNLDSVVDNLQRRGFTVPVTAIHSLESTRRELQTKTQELQHQRNTHSKAIGVAKSNGESADELLKQMATINAELSTADRALETIQQQWHDLVAGFPNLIHDSVPDGFTEAEAQEIRSWGDKPEFSFKPKDHVELGAGLDAMDFALAAKISGARFTVLKGVLAKLHRSLAQFMLDFHTEKQGYQEVYVPFLVAPASLYGTGQLPKFGEDLFVTHSEQQLTLIPTAEVPVTNLARDVIFEANQLPLRLVAHTPCFRSEAGSYGKDTRGMIRQHQFEKVELVHFAKPEESYATLELLVQHAEAILQALELPYRVISLAAGDTGFSAAKTYDIEVWLPGQARYREISSCSNCEDFQARRMQARWRNPQTGKPEFIHTLNGSGLPIGRTLVAILENYQDADGGVRVPKVLQPYLSGVSKIKQ